MLPPPLAVSPARRTLRVVYIGYYRRRLHIVTAGSEAYYTATSHTIRYPPAASRPGSHHHDRNRVNQQPAPLDGTSGAIRLARRRGGTG